MKICYAAESALAYSIDNAAKGFANNGMTAEQRATVNANDIEYRLR